jgi:hypothetical protein
MLKGFVPGLLPTDPQYRVNEILEKDNNCLESCYGRVTKSDGGICVIQIEPGSCLVIKSLRLDLLKYSLGVSDIRFEPKNSCVTILDQLTVTELYNRIKSYYENVLKNCLGKSPEDQMIYLFGDDMQNGSLHLKYREKDIENSESLIRDLPFEASDIQLKSLVIEVFHKSLEYAVNSRDEYCVSMKSYAEELGSRLLGNTDTQTWFS